MDGKLYKPLQKELVLRALQSETGRRKGITVLDLMMSLHIGDPRARIRDLREDGYDIETVFRDKDGKFHPWGVYFLREEEVCPTES